MSTTFDVLVQNLNYHLNEFRRGTQSYVQLLQDENKRLVEVNDGLRRVIAKLDAQLKHNSESELKPEKSAV